MSGLFGEKCVEALKNSNYSVTSKGNGNAKVIPKKDQNSPNKKIFESDFVKEDKTPVKTNKEDEKKENGATKLKLNNSPYVPPPMPMPTPAPSGYERLLNKTQNRPIQHNQGYNQIQPQQQPQVYNNNNPYLVQNQANINNKMYHQNQNPSPGYYNVGKAEGYPSTQPSSDYRHFPGTMEPSKKDAPTGIFPSTIIQQQEQSKISNPSPEIKGSDLKKNTLYSSGDLKFDSKLTQQPLSGFGYVRNLEFQTHSELLKQNEMSALPLGLGEVKATYSDIPKTNEYSLEFNQAQFGHPLPPLEERSYDIKESDIKGLKDILEDDDDDVLLGTYSIGDDDINEEDLEEVEEFISAQSKKWV